MKRSLEFLLVALALAAALVATRAALFRSRQVAAEPVRVEVDAQAAAQRLSRAIRVQTVSYQDPAQRKPEELRAFQELLAELFPRAHAALVREVAGGGALLYTWRGKDAGRAPILLLAHQDVVPVDAAGRWTHPPFSGDVADGFVWGRGTMDDKASALAILEAVELLAAQGFQPERTVYIAYGHDEEVGGTGAKAVAALLAQRKVAPEMVLDEGLAITDGIVPGVAAPVALVGVAEKGFATLHLSVEGEGGHSSMPPPHTAVGVLAAAIARLEAHPMPAALSGPSEKLFQFAGPEMGFGMRVVFANLWATRPLVTRLLEGKPSTNALIRTTAAATMFEGSPKDNVLPERATAAVNFRIRPGDTVQSVMEHVRRVVDDARVAVEVDPAIAVDPTPESSVEAEGFAVLQKSVREVFPGAVVAPSLVVGATDARHFTGLCKNVYRFLPLELRGEDLPRLHGTDERIPVDGYADAVRFYARFLTNASTGR